MQKLAGELRFEEAQKIKEKYEVIENYRSKSTVVTPMLHNIDVFSLAENENSAYINYLHIGNGAIVQAYTFEYKKRLDESKEDLLSLGIIEMRNRFKSTAREIIVPFPLDIELENVSITVPQRGDKKKLVELSEMNVKQYKVDKLKQAEKLNPEQRSTRLLKEIQDTLHLSKLPAHIECFDNSNIQGSDAVAACVVFKMAKPSKKDYRKYNIKTVVGPDDYASMKEVVRRHRRRNSPARPDHHRRWKGTNGSRTRSDPGRTALGYSDCRAGKRRETPDFGTPVRLPSRNNRHADTKFHVQILHANTGRGASCCYRLP